ncbi:MAG: hypothetical protein ABI910_02375 [Gemmatimonadota bacterium]
MLTHHPRPPLDLEGGTSFTVVTEGTGTSLQLAQAATGGHGWPRVARRSRSAAARMPLVGSSRRRRVDEMDISLVPILLGRGERLIGAVGDDLHGLTLVRTIEAPQVSYLKFARR